MKLKKNSKINRSNKTKLLNELSQISTNLKFKRKNMLSDYRDNNYANIEDIKYNLLIFFFFFFLYEYCTYKQI